MPKVMQCDEGDFNPATGTCAAPYFGDAPSVFPTLSIADAQEVGIAIVWLWGIAFGLRAIRKFLVRFA